MIISLLGYMGSGKSHISKLLSQKTHFKVFDLDAEIEKRNHKTIAEIFKEKGEIYFRKLEHETLNDILTTENQIILSLGGGTPVYYNNMDLINQYSESFYLNANIGLLTQRLSKNKEKRPLIARISDEDLPEFIAKHLFERNPYYLKAKHIININNKTDHEICKEIEQTVNAN